MGPSRRVQQHLRKRHGYGPLGYGTDIDHFKLPDLPANQLVKGLLSNRSVGAAMHDLAVFNINSSLTLWAFDRHAH
jgi:hypothetical protein